MNALVATILSALAAVIVLAPRRWALLAMLAGVLYLAHVVAVQIGGFNLYPARILEVTALARIVARREFTFERMNRLDRVLVALYAFSVTAFALRSGEGLAYQIATALDALFVYAVFRSWIRDFDDFTWLLRGLVVLLLPYVPLLWVETLTFRNPFAPLGGVELIRAGDLWIRDGRLRATGSFGHPSLLGTLGGTFLALYIGLWVANRALRKTALLGVVLCLAIVGAANSGGPAICVAVTVIGWMLWPLRREMHIVRVGLVATLVLLALFMKAPIWYVLARISDLTGGDGYHRAVLLDIGFKNLHRWWLAGMPAQETSRWLPYSNANTGVVDMTNTFLQFGVNSGLGAILLLVALLTVAFSQLGSAMSAARSGSRVVQPAEPLLWGLGVVLCVHIFNWFGITYWDQTYAVWFLHLAAIGSLSQSLIRRKAIDRSARHVGPIQGETTVGPARTREGRARVVGKEGLRSDRRSPISPPVRRREEVATESPPGPYDRRPTT
jgi:hypothetical protein